MQAMAAEAGEAAHAVAFYATAEFWVFVAFVLLIAIAGGKIYRIAVIGLDSRAATIRARIDEAEKLRDEAQEMLVKYQRQQNEAAGETEQMVEKAKAEAERLTEKAAEDLGRSLKRREQLAMDRIAHAEASALKEVRSAAVDVALEATRRILAENLPADKAEALINDSIKGLPGKLH
jgi:F-type H+-transporting ATPase subunit b